MEIVVQKFGGTSVATDDGRKRVIEKIRRTKSDGKAPVVVVSAMGRKGAPYATDTLLALANEANPALGARELDQLLCCGEMISAVYLAGMLQAAGLEAAMLTGGQAGILTDENYGNARILHIERCKIDAVLEAGRIPVICGFQGVTNSGDFTTLGRGGSDTTAAALGAALDAQCVEIYTDVDGIMTADPRIVEQAKILERVSYGEVCQLAYQGAKVIHPRAVEIAMQKCIPLVIKSTFSDAAGTLIADFSAAGPCCADKVVDQVATGVTYLDGVCQVKVDCRSGSSGVDVFKTLASADISVDLINVLPGYLLFTIAEHCAARAAEKMREIGYEAEFLPSCAKVSVIGGGMREVPGVMADFVEALAAEQIEILQSADSHTSISVLIRREFVSAAVRALHEKFHLWE